MFTLKQKFLDSYTTKEQTELSNKYEVWQIRPKHPKISLPASRL